MQRYFSARLLDTINVSFINKKKWFIMLDSKVQLFSSTF